MSEYRNESPTHCLKEIECIMWIIFMKKFPLLYCDLKFAGSKMCVCLCGGGMTSYND